MSKMGCVARSLGKSSLTDTKLAFIRLAILSTYPQVNAFAKVAFHFDRQVCYNPRTSSHGYTSPVTILLLLVQFWIDRTGVVTSVH